MPQAIPGVSSSSNSGGNGGVGSGSGSRAQGLLRVVSGAQLDRQDAADAAQKADTDKPVEIDGLANYIRGQWEIFRNNRNQGNDALNDRLTRSQRMFEGVYDPNKLAEILRFGGSRVYSRLVAVKCRGASAMMREIYLGPDRPWDIQPQPDPPVPAEVQANIAQLVSTEVQSLKQAGQPVIQDQAHLRYMNLMHAATAAARRNAQMQAQATSDKIEDLLVAGGFYEALTEFLVDLPMFAFACIKGPVVRMVPKLTWGDDGTPSFVTKPQMFWERKSPFDIYWTPGVSHIEDAAIIERKRLTRTDLNDLIGLPGYDEKAIRGALEDYRNGYRDWLDSNDTERAIYEGRENPTFNQSAMIDALEYHGNIQGQMLLDQGIDPKLIPDPDRDYAVQCWIVGNHVLKTQLNPSPRQRHPYFVTSFEKIPGTVSGHALPDLLEDLQEIANATLRSMVNNLAMSSGPQVVVNDDMLSPTENGDDMYPWKRWHVSADPMGQGGPPVTFFQPQSNAQELMQIYQQATSIADEVSAIPRYLTGSSMSGGAGRTASGLSMLMGNAEKVLQTVASNIDTDVMRPLLDALYDMIMLTDRSGLLTGEEEIRVRGVNVAVQKETERQKQLQFLQITANPIDAPIVGQVGRARILRSIAADLGLPDDIVPGDQEIQQQVAQAEAQKNAMMAAQAHGIPGAPGGPAPMPPPGSPPPPGPPSPGAVAQGAQAPSPTPTQLSDQAPPNNQFQGIPQR